MIEMRVNEPGTPTPESNAPVRSQHELILRRFLRHRMAVISVFVLVLLTILCFSAHWLAPHTPDWQNDALSPASPNHHALLGYDSDGHDVLSGLLYGGQVSLKIGLAVALFSTLLGTAVGAVAGWYRGAIDSSLMRLTDFFLIIPQLAALAIGLRWITGPENPPSQFSMIIVLVLLFWMPIARVVPAQVLSLREKEFVEAARASGAGPVRIIVFHLLPNCLGPILVAATLAVAGAVLTEAAAAYLGFGLKFPVTSWGIMLSNAKIVINVLPDEWWELLFPSLALFIVVFCINFIGDGLRDAFDPQAVK